MKNKLGKLLMLQFLQNISFYTPEVQTFGISRTFVMETPRTLFIAQESFGVSKTIAQHSIFWSLQRKMFGVSKSIAQHSMFWSFQNYCATISVLEFPTKDVTSEVWSFQLKMLHQRFGVSKTIAQPVYVLEFPTKVVT